MEYNDGTKRTRYSSVPTSDITAEMVTADGFVLAQKDSAGIETSATRSYTASGMQLIRTDRRGNTTTTVTDIAGRALTGNTACYRYDVRGRKVAEWGTSIQPACFGYDADGNQTSLKTATGIWSVEYNAENRPTRFTSEDGSTVIECTYDSMGRRATKKVTTDGSITQHRRFIYRGYRQIACCDLTRSGHPCLWLLTCDPTQPVATRPLAIRKDGTWFAYGWDLTKNICEVFGPAGYIRTAYTYAPYGEVSESGDVTQPIQWSSEYHDTELALVYYNYRHYNPIDGRWMGRDPLMERSGYLLLGYVHQSPIMLNDAVGTNVIGAAVAAVAVSLVSYYFMSYAKEAYDYAGNDDDKQHCYMACMLSQDLGANLAYVIAVLKEYSDVFKAKIEELIGIIGEKAFERIVMDSMYDYYADLKCLKADSKSDCKCCCNDA